MIAPCRGRDQGRREFGPEPVEGLCGGRIGERSKIRKLRRGELRRRRGCGNCVGQLSLCNLSERAHLILNAVETRQLGLVPLEVTRQFGEVTFDLLEAFEVGLARDTFDRGHEALLESVEALAQRLNRAVGFHLGQGLLDPEGDIGEALIQPFAVLCQGLKDFTAAIRDLRRCDERDMRDRHGGMNVGRGGDE